MIFSFFILSLLTIAVWLDEKMENKKYVLGEEWDFTKPNYRSR